jgi:methylated-DNA-[protein]-cysteine S-methyltransferase
MATRSADFTTATLASPVGELAFALDAGGALAALVFAGQGGLAELLGAGADVVADPKRAEAGRVAAELRAYFAGELREFATPVAPVIGTAFQRRVWAALRRIPFGTTWSYAELAAEVGSVARAVGGANGANPVSIIVPCHRVIGADGSLTGYAGGLERKRWLLRHEGALLA